MQVEIYSDIACPWCYVGKTRFERALTAFPGAADVAVTYRPFQLNPATSAQPMPLTDYYDQRFGPEFRNSHVQVGEIAAADGLEFQFDRALAVNTFTAHRLLWLAARDYGAAVQRDLKEALLRAYFTDGRNVNDHETLAEIAAGAGVDPDRARAWLAGDDGVDEVHAALDDARDLGIAAVPTFVFNGRYAVQGAQPASVFLSVLERVAAESAESHNTSETVTDTGENACDDGSCAV